MFAEILNKFGEIESQSICINHIQEYYLQKLKDIKQPIRNDTGHANRGICKQEAIDAYNLTMRTDLLQLISYSIFEIIE